MNFSTYLFSGGRSQNAGPQPKRRTMSILGIVMGDFSWYKFEIDFIRLRKVVEAGLVQLNFPNDHIYFKVINQHKALYHSKIAIKLIFICNSHKNLKLVNNSINIKFFVTEIAGWSHERSERRLKIFRGSGLIFEQREHRNCKQ